MARTFTQRILSLSIAISLLVAVVATTIYFVVYRGPMDLMAKAKSDTLHTADELAAKFVGVVRDLKQELHIEPQIVISNQTVHSATVAIAELATAEKSFQQDHLIETTWLGSTKRFHARGQFVAKAGFDLNQTIRIEVADDGKNILISLPQAQLLSLEQKEIQILEDESGYWNKITREHREEAMGQLTQLARQSVEQSSLMNEAKQAFRDQIATIIRRHMPEDATISIELVE
jgi:hypothetical protein